MLFNSLDFAIFLPIVFILYWFVTNKNLKLQNFLIVAASYFFYGCWDWRFLSLIFFSTLVDYTIGLNLSTQENQTKRKLLLYTSIAVNLGFLGFFKSKKSPIIEILKTKEKTPFCSSKDELEEYVEFTVSNTVRKS